MLDAALVQNSNGYDINISNYDIQSIDNFKTAIEVSLFSDARADGTQIATPQYRRGWIGDIASPVEGQNYGSLLWLIEQARLTQETLNNAVFYARQSLQWLIDQGIAISVNVSGSIIPTQGIALNITVKSTLGQTENHYVELWENTKNAD